MKKSMIASTLAVLLGAFSLMCTLNTAQAQYVGPSQTQAQTYTTVSQILKNPVDDRYFNLKGKITDKLGHERYTFTDSTGSIRAEIDDDRFMGVQVGPETVVEVWGKVDTSRTKPVKIDVKRLTIVK